MDSWFSIPAFHLSQTFSPVSFSGYAALANVSAFSLAALRTTSRLADYRMAPRNDSSSKPPIEGLLLALSWSLTQSMVALIFFA
jgi:hypothetical protein